MEEKCLWGIIDGLRDDVNCHIDAITDLNDCIDKLQAENKELESKVSSLAIRLSLKPYSLNKRNKELKAEIKALKEQVNDLMIDKDRLMTQVNSKWSNNSNTHTHTIDREIQDYMNHHPEHKEVRLFILPSDDFKDGDYNHGVYWDDGVEV